MHCCGYKSLLAHGLVGLSALVLFCNRSAQAIPLNFAEAGQSVSGYQDDFLGTSRNAGWQVVGPGGDVYTLPGDGTLHVGSATGDPNHLLYNGPAYNSANQNVLALVKLNAIDAGDGGRGGIATATDSGSSQGINLLFRSDGNIGPGRHFNLLDDAVAWGPNTGSDTWDAGTYYWLRLTHDSSNNIAAKIWPGDGVTPEPASPTLTWTQGTRVGLAGITASSNGTLDMQVDYILIQASGLPSISVVPEPSSLAMLGLGVLGLALFRRRKTKLRSFTI